MEDDAKRFQLFGSKLGFCNLWLWTRHNKVCQMIRGIYK